MSKYVVNFVSLLDGNTEYYGNTINVRLIKGSWI